MSSIGWKETIEKSALTNVEQATAKGKLARPSKEAADLQQVVADFGTSQADVNERAAFVRGLLDLPTAPPASPTGQKGN